MADLYEPRLIKESGIDAKITALLEPIIIELGFRVVRIRMMNMNGLVMQIMAERSDGTFTINDCEAISKAISPVLDIEDPVAGEYNLEVSSPGIDRPLVRRSDFDIWGSNVLKMETSHMIDGRKRFRGFVTKTSDESLTLERVNAGKDEQTTFEIPYDALVEAKLIMTDDLLKDAQNFDKAAQAAKGE